MISLPRSRLRRDGALVQTLEHEIATKFDSPSADAVAASGVTSLLHSRELAAEIESQSQSLRQIAEALQPHQPVEEKQPLWDAEARLRNLHEQRMRAVAEAETAFATALQVDPSCKSAADGACELRYDRYLEAERRRDDREMLYQRLMLSTLDRAGRFIARLDAPGRLLLRTYAWDCPCLQQATVGGWEVSYADRPDTPWVEGRLRPDLPPLPRDTFVPAIRTGPTGQRFGHAPGCPRREIEGVDVFVARYEERDRRFVTGPEIHLGVTPLTHADLPQGSWRVRLAPPPGSPLQGLTLPIRIDRDSVWEQEATLYRANEIPPGFLPVSCGPFLFGNPSAQGGKPEETRVTEDFFMSRFAVTCREWLDYMNDLCATGRAEEATRRQPRDSGRRLWIAASVAPGEVRFRMPASGEDPRFDWQPGWPVLGVSWDDARAFCQWRSKREGRLYTLPHEEEYEKAARGVDARIFPWGDHYDGTFAHTNVSIAGKVVPMPVGTFPADESPYGIRDLAGSASTWCWNSPVGAMKDHVCLRGGSWTSPWITAQAASRSAATPGSTLMRVGVRLVVRAVTG